MPNRCSADIQPSRDPRFADSCEVEVLDLGGLLCRSCVATQAGSVQPCLGQSGAAGMEATAPTHPQRGSENGSERTLFLFIRPRFHQKPGNGVGGCSPPHSPSSRSAVNAEALSIKEHEELMRLFVFAALLMGFVSTQLLAQPAVLSTSLNGIPSRSRKVNTGIIRILVVQTVYPKMGGGIFGLMGQ